MKVARWERFLLPSIDTQLLASHVVLLSSLAYNLQRRDAAKRAFDRTAQGHKRLAMESATLVHECVRHAAQWLRLLVMPLVKELSQPLSSDVQQRRERLRKCHDALMLSWRDSYAMALSGSKPKVCMHPPRCHTESIRSPITCTPPTHLHPAHPFAPRPITCTPPNRLHHAHSSRTPTWHTLRS